MDTRWPQEIVVKPIEEIVANTNTNTCGKSGGVERKARPQKEEALNCPRCHSTNTKFCYYNNYSLTQPRYFCKTCRRYWTQGGSLRNIPVGGGSRKNKRSSSSSNSCSKKLPPEDPTLSHIVHSSHTHSPKILQGQDLNLGFPEFGNIRDPLVQVNENTNINNMCASSSTSSSCQLSAMELLSGISCSSKGLPMGSIHQDPNTVFPLHSASTPYPTLHNLQHSTANLSFPFQDLKQVSAPSHNSTSTGYWTAMLGASGGSNW